MEDKLESYRLRKRRSEQVQSIKEKFFSMLTFPTSQKLEEAPETSVKIDVSKYVRFSVDNK